MRSAVAMLLVLCAITLPLMLFQLAFRMDMVEHSKAVSVGPFAEAYLYSLCASMIFGSALAAGFLKALLKEQNHELSILAVLGCGSLLISVAALQRGLLPVLSEAHVGDESPLRAFFIIWGATTLYILKVPWDEYRDIISAKMKTIKDEEPKARER